MTDIKTRLQITGHIDYALMDEAAGTISALERRVEELESQLEHAHRGEDAAVEHGRTIRQRAYEDAAQAAYRICAETRDLAAEAIRALSKGTGE